MTACVDFKEDLSAFIDGELEPARQSELTEHLGTCEACKDEHGQLRQTVSLLAQSKLAAVAECPDLWSQLAEKLPPICELVEDDFSAYLDGELIVPAKEGVSEHLQACSPCHGKFQELSQVNGLLSQGLELSASVEVDLWSQIRSRLDEDCQLIKDELSSFYDREVTPQRHRTITTHLLECADCRDQLALVTQTGEMLRTNYQPELPEDFDLWPEIKNKMQVVQFAPREKRKREFSSKRIYAIAAVFTGGALAALTLFLNLNFSPVSVKPVTAESYLIESALGEPADMAEAMVYENQ
ncbi:MAG: zf-HC2 domain-containing protein [Candidatus Obscuribacterales bacterium]|nr:zf-HC2 domain-containing protein [Candidatus Obscuribacterales bacterium]